MKKILATILAVYTSATMADGLVSVKNVEAQQRYPWNGLVDVVVTLNGELEDVSAAQYLFAATNCTTHTEIPVFHITRRGGDIGASNIWKRAYVWEASADVGAIKIDDVALTVNVKKLGGVQLWENGPYWAECNVGATKPEEYGHYFWWGDSVGYERNGNDDGWVSVKDGTAFDFSSRNCPTYGKDNATLQSLGYIDEAGNLVAAHDAATQHLGPPWRMPTDAEFTALINNCTTTWIRRNYVFGRLVTGKGAYASKSIFLPAAGLGNGSGISSAGLRGFCWFSTPKEISSDALRLEFSSSYFIRFVNYRYLGQSVRPIRGFVK